MFRVQYSTQSVKKLSKIPKNTAERIRNNIRNLAKNPFRKMNHIKKLVGVDAYRSRVGDWRVVYRINKAASTIIIIKIEARGGVYK